MKHTKAKSPTGEQFDALPEVQKEKIFRELANKSTEQLLAESKPLNKTERAEWRRLRKRLGRPRIGKGTRNISVSVEKTLLKAADRFAKAHGMSRSELIARGVRAVIGFAA